MKISVLLESLKLKSGAVLEAASETHIIRINFSLLARQKAWLNTKMFPYAAAFSKSQYIGLN